MNDYESDYNEEDFENEQDNLQPMMRRPEPATDEEEDLPDYQRSREELNHAILQKLHAISQDCLDNGNHSEALANYDKCLSHYFSAVGQDPLEPGFADYFKSILKFLNDYALKLLKENEIEAALAILNTCDVFTNGKAFGMFPASRNLTLNHLACCYRRVGNLERALEYLEDALNFVVANERVDTSGITHINMCAVLSQMNK